MRSGIDQCWSVMLFPLLEALSPVSVLLMSSHHSALSRLSIAHEDHGKSLLQIWFITHPTKQKKNLQEKSQLTGLHGKNSMKTVRISSEQQQQQSDQQVEGPWKKQKKKTEVGWWTIRAQKCGARHGMEERRRKGEKVFVLGKVTKLANNAHKACNSHTLQQGFGGGGMVIITCCWCCCGCCWCSV